MITRIVAASLLLVGLGMAQVQAPHPEPMFPGPEMRIMTQRRQVSPEWWKNPELAQKIGLSDAQVQKLNQIDFDSRMKMIDLNAALQREELKMQPLMEASTPDENQILAQVDKIASQRAQVEKARIQKMLAIRRVLTPEQWKKFQTSMPMMMHHEMGGHDGDHNEMRQGGDKGPGPGGEMPPMPPASTPPPQE
jgi:periplasmic protein CpxP/Spy